MSVLSKPRQSITWPQRNNTEDLNPQIKRPGKLEYCKTFGPYKFLLVASYEVGHIPKHVFLQFVISC